MLVEANIMAGPLLREIAGGPDAIAARKFGLATVRFESSGRSGKEQNIRAKIDDDRSQ